MHTPRGSVALLVLVVMGLTPWLSAAEPLAKTRAASRQQTQRPTTSRADRTDSTTAKSPSSRKVGATEAAIFAGGCFWCTEAVFERLKGIRDVESGYSGGTAATASYEKVHEGTTRHAEAIRVTYDPTKISYEQLLDVFFDAHDPTQLNRQGADDVGRQYRSAIFFANDEQKQKAEAKIAKLRETKVYKRRIVTRLEPLVAFYPAEEFHQNFALKNPFEDYIQSHAVPRACQVQIKHPELIDPAK